MGRRILAGILAYYRFPDETFVGSPERIRALKQALAQANRCGRPGALAEHATGPGAGKVTDDACIGHPESEKGAEDRRGLPSLEKTRLMWGTG